MITTREGRKERGDKFKGTHSQSKLSFEDLIAIGKDKGIQVDIAKKYGISQARVSLIQLAYRRGEIV